MYQNAGEKGRPHPSPDDPPRRRANKVRGHGTFDRDRPPILGVVGRSSKALRLWVLRNSTKTQILPLIGKVLRKGTLVHTDEWSAYHDLPIRGFDHRAVSHGKGEYARDDDGDGTFEVHNNTMEGIWTGLRNFLRPFRGVSKWKLGGYVALFMAIYNHKNVSPQFIAAMTRLHL